MKEIRADSASLVNLRAELENEKRNYEKAKKDKKRPAKCESKWLAKDSAAMAKKPKIPVAVVDNSKWEDIEKKLQLKSELYERLQSGKLDIEDLSSGQQENLLVDFYRKDLPETDEEGRVREPDISSDLEIVEYTDEFGRTRTAPKSEYEFVRESEAQEEYEIKDSFYDESKEIRTKGVGYFNLSLDSDTRNQQIKELKDLNKQTESEKKRRQALKQERELKKQQRLAKVKEKRKFYSSLEAS